MKKIFLTAVLAGIVWMPGRAEIVNGDFVMNVPSGSAVLTEEQVAEILGGDCQRLVKRGAGALVNTNAVLAPFTGDIIIEEGELHVWQVGDLGTAEGKTVVSNGATLAIVSVPGSSTTKAQFGMEPLVISGAGTPQKNGALYLKTGNTVYTDHFRNLTLNGDATIACVDRINISTSLNMNGHTLTKTGNGLFAFSSAITNPGHIILNGSSQFQYGSSMGGTASNTLTIADGAKMMRYESSINPAWTLIMGNDAQMYAWIMKTPEENYYRWTGPVVLNGRALFWAQANVPMYLFGDISGPGALWTAGKDGKFSEMRPFTLNLYGSNTYTGGTVINDNVTLNVHGTRSVPTAAPLVITNAAAVNLLSALTAVTELPKIYWHTVSNAVMTGFDSVAGGLVKTGTGALTVPWTIFTGPVEIRGGTVRLPYGPSGYWESIKYDVTGSQTWDMTFGSTNLVTSMRMAYDSAFGAGVSVLYRTYIWNRQATNETWSFVESIDENVLIRMDGKNVLQNSTWNKPTSADVVLTPGPHEMLVFLNNIYGSGGASSNGWGVLNFGIGYDALGRGGVDPATYLKIADPGDGSLVTRTLKLNTAETPYTNVTDLVLDHATVLDARGNYQQIDSVTSEGGCVSNAVLMITKTLTVAGGAGGLSVRGRPAALVLSEGVGLSVTDADTLDRSTPQVICSTLSEITGPLPVLDAETSQTWNVRFSQDRRSLLLTHSAGSVFLVR